MKLVEAKKSRMNRMSKETQKKSNVKVIVLAVVCIVLAASLVGVIAIYQPTTLHSQIAEKDNQISELQTQIQLLQTQLSQSIDASTYALQIASLNSQIQGLNDTLTDILSDYQNLQNIVALQKSGILYDAEANQEANSAKTIWNNNLDYAGYIVVQATSSSSTTYAQVLYTFGEVNFDFNQTLGELGTAVFAVLPSIVEVRIGNTGAEANNSTVTATYYY